jgi:hypothetical protein
MDHAGMPALDGVEHHFADIRGARSRNVSPLLASSSLFRLRWRVDELEDATHPAARVKTNAPNICACCARGVRSHSAGRDSERLLGCPTAFT